MEILPSIYIFTCYLEYDGEPPGLLWLQIGGNSLLPSKGICTVAVKSNLQILAVIRRGIKYLHFGETKSFLFLEVIGYLQKNEMHLILFDNHCTRQPS